MLHRHAGQRTGWARAAGYPPTGARSARPSWAQTAVAPPAPRGAAGCRRRAGPDDRLGGLIHEYRWAAWRGDAGDVTGHVIKEFLVDYHQARPHQSLETALPRRTPSPGPAARGRRDSPPGPTGRVTPRVLVGRLIELTERVLRHRLAFDVNQASYVGLLAASSTDGATGGIAGLVLTTRLRGAGAGSAWTGTAIDSSRLWISLSAAVMAATILPRCASIRSAWSTTS